MLDLSDDQLIELLSKRLRDKSNVQVKGADDYLQSKLDEVKSQFLSDIRNDINNPLAAIIGFSQMLSENEDLSPDKIKKFASSILFDAQNLDFHLENIILSAEFESGKIIPDVKTATLIKLFEIELGKVQYLTNKTGHKIVVDYNNIDTDQKFKTDKHLFSMLIRNLLINAMRYSDPSPISVSITNQWDHIIISIKDEGDGFGEEELTGVFNRFNRLAAPKNGFSTSSVCLSLVKSICEMLSYDVQLDSKPGEGTTYSLVIDNTAEIVDPMEEMNDFSTDDFDLF